MRWTTSLGSPIRAAPVIGSDGTVYVGNTTGNFYAVRTDGTVAWHASLGKSITLSAAIVGGVVCVAAQTGSGVSGLVYGLTARGDQVWKYDDHPFADLTAASDQTLLFADGIGLGLVALAPDGTLRWSVNIGDSVNSSPATMPTDGTIVVGGGSAQVALYGIAPDGHPRWQLTAVTGQSGPAAISPDGTSLVVGTDGTVYSVSAQGTLNWQKQIGGWDLSTPDIGADGTVYISGPEAPQVDSGMRPDAVLLSINAADGSVRWTAAVGTWTNQDFSSPIMGSDGTLYVGSADGKLYAIAADGSQRWTVQTGGPILTTGAIGADGTLYIGSDDGNLYAIGP